MVEVTQAGYPRVLTKHESGGWKFLAERREGDMIYGWLMKTSGEPGKMRLGFHFSHFVELRDDYYAS